MFVIFVSYGFLTWLSKEGKYLLLKNHMHDSGYFGDVLITPEYCFATRQKK